MEPTLMPLADGIEFKCDGQQVAIGPNICSTDVLETTLDATGYDILEGAPLLDLSG